MTTPQVHPHFPQTQNTSLDPEKTARERKRFFSSFEAENFIMNIAFQAQEETLRTTCSRTCWRNVGRIAQGSSWTTRGEQTAIKTWSQQRQASLEEEKAETRSKTDDQRGRWTTLGGISRWPGLCFKPWSIFSYLLIFSVNSVRNRSSRQKFGNSKNTCYFSIPRRKIWRNANGQDASM